MKRLFFSILVLFVVASISAQDSRKYLPQPTTDYEYIFINDKNEIIRKKWNIYFHDYFLRSELIEDKVVGDLVARFEGCEIEKELFEYTRYDEAVIFDYSKQVGDTLNVPIDSSFSLSSSTDR